MQSGNEQKRRTPKTKDQTQSDPSDMVSSLTPYSVNLLLLVLKNRASYITPRDSLHIITKVKVKFRKTLPA